MSTLRKSGESVVKTSSLTRFFRNTGHFRTLEYIVLPELQRRIGCDPDRKIRLLSAGCSSGEEPYSLAILLKEILPESRGFEIVAVDIDSDRLTEAAAGFYRAERLHGLRPRHIPRYFERHNGGFVVSPVIKQSVQFVCHDLVSGIIDTGIDIGFCRNVMMYLQPPEREAVLDMLAASMTPHSPLFVGGSENLIGTGSKFEIVTSVWGSYYRKTGRSTEETTGI